MPIQIMIIETGSRLVSEEVFPRRMSLWQESIQFEILWFASSREVTASVSIP
jgi:hypothetical protein